MEALDAEKIRAYFALSGAEIVHHIPGGRYHYLLPDGRRDHHGWHTRDAAMRAALYVLGVEGFR